MARFCTRCGTQNADDAAFCEACGHSLPLRVAPPPPVIEPATAAGKRSGGRTALLWGSVIGILLLVIAAAGVALTMNRKPEFSPEQLSEAIRQYLLATPQISENLVCLSNLPYQQPEFRVRADNQPTNDWLGLLVEGGLYAAPREEMVDRGELGIEEQRVYLRSEAGTRVVRGNRLCFADGIEFARLDGVAGPVENKNGATATARFYYRYRNAQAWVQNPRAGQLMPALFAQSEWPAGAELARGEKTAWQVVRLIDGALAEQAVRQAAENADRKPAAGGFAEWLKKLFSADSASGGNPLIGRWRAEAGGLGNLAGMAGVMGGNADMQGKLLLTLEFSADKMRLMGQDIPVSYTVKSGEVLVKPLKKGGALPGNGDSLTFRIQDREHIALDLMLAEIPYTRER